MGPDIYVYCIKKIQFFSEQSPPNFAAERFFSLLPEWSFVFASIAVGSCAKIGFRVRMEYPPHQNRISKAILKQNSILAQDPNAILSKKIIPFWRKREIVLCSKIEPFCSETIVSPYQYPHISSSNNPSIRPVLCTYFLC